MKNILLLALFIFSFTKVQSQDCPDKLICHNQITISLAERTSLFVDDFLSNHQEFRNCSNDKIQLFSLLNAEGELLESATNSLSTHCALSTGYYTVKVGQYFFLGEYLPETILQECTTELTITGTPVKCSFSDEVYDINLLSTCSNADIVNVNGARLEVTPGETICVPFTTTNFNSIISFQAAIGWDSKVLSFISMNSEVLGRDLAYNADFQENDYLIASWSPTVDDLIMNGLDIDDNTVLFEMCFEVIGSPGDYSLISFLDREVPVEFGNVIDGLSNVTDYCVSPGALTVSGGGLSSKFKIILNDQELDLDEVDLGVLSQNQLLQGGNTIRFEPIEFDNYLDGVSTIDIVLGMKMLLLEEPIDPVKAIALDVDYSGGINVKDLVLMRQLILGQRLDLPHPGYFYLEKQQVIEGSFDEFDFGYFDTYIFEKDELNDGQLNFKVFKYGDVSLTQFHEEQSEVRSSYESIAFENSYARAGEIQHVRFSIDGDSEFDINAFQFALDLEDARVIDVDHAYSSSELMTNDLEGEQFNVLYSSITPRDKIEFEIVVEFKTSGYIADRISLNKSFQVELVKGDLSLTSLKLLAIR